MKGTEYYHDAKAKEEADIEGKQRCRAPGIL
jgi:hypothetical protein